MEIYDSAKGGQLNLDNLMRLKAEQGPDPPELVPPPAEGSF